LSFPRVLPVGDAALTVELGDTLSPATNARVLSLDRDLALAPFEGFREAVPSHRSLLVLFDPAAARFGALANSLVARATRGDTAPAPGRLHEVEVVYGGESGPDLADLARERGLSERDLVDQCDPAQAAGQQDVDGHQGQHREPVLVAAQEAGHGEGQYDTGEDQDDLCGGPG